jgi:hypothetical protein
MALLTCLGLLLGESSAQDVEEEPLAQVAVLGVLQCVADGPDQRRTFGAVG